MNEGLETRIHTMILVWFVFDWTVCKLSSVQQYYLILDSTSLLLLVVHGLIIPTSQAFTPTAFITSAMETEDVRVQYRKPWSWKSGNYEATHFMILQFLSCLCQPSVWLMLTDVTACDNPDTPALVSLVMPITVKSWMNLTAACNVSTFMLLLQFWVIYRRWLPSPIRCTLYVHLCVASPNLQHSKWNSSSSGLFDISWV